MSISNYTDSRVQAHKQGLVPLQYRLLVINGVNIPWNAYLSIQANKGKSAAPKRVDDITPAA